MKTSRLLIAATALSLFSTSLLPDLGADESDVPKAAVAMMKAESLGGLRLEMPAESVIQLLGQPTKQGALTMQEADGAYVQSWHYPAKGIDLVMTTGDKKSGPKTVSTITGTAACPFATKKGIKIGSGESETRKAYKAEASRETSSEDGTFVAGSVYGGIIFTFKKGKVTRIFFGAAAE